MKKIIAYRLEKRNFGTAGNPRIIDVPVIADEGDRAIWKRLTGKNTIDDISRELIRDFTGGRVDFMRVDTQT